MYIPGFSTLLYELWTLTSHDQPCTIQLLCELLTRNRGGIVSSSCQQASGREDVWAMAAKWSALSVGRFRLSTRRSFSIFRLRSFQLSLFTRSSHASRFTCLLAGQVCCFRVGCVCRFQQFCMTCAPSFLSNMSLRETLPECQARPRGRSNY